MIPLRAEPFCYRDLKGTSWYSRFTAEEFYIFLDHYPDRMIIEDSFVTGDGFFPDKAVEEYRSHILDYFMNAETGKGRDDKTPLRVLVDLRRIRQICFPDIIFSNPPSSPFLSGRNPASGPDTDTDHIRSILEKIYPGYSVSFSSRLKERLSRADEIIFIPGSARTLRDELAVIRMMTAGNVRIIPAGVPELPGVTSVDIRRIISGIEIPGVFCSKRELTLDGNSFEVDGESPVFADEDTFVLTSNIWYYLSVFRIVCDLGFIISNREWFSLGLFQESREKPDNHLGGMRNGSYTKMIWPVQPPEGVLVADLQTRPFPEDVDTTGVAYSALSFGRFLEGRAPELLEDKLRRQAAFIRERLSPVEFESVRLGIDASGQIQIADSGKEGTLVTSLIIPEKSVSCQPLLFGSCVPPENLDISGKGFLSPFNYYFTSNLVKLYNSQICEEQKIPFENFFIDYLGKRDGGLWNETIPLFSKAFLGCTKKGSLFSGHFPLKEAGLFLDGDEIVFPGDKINPGIPPEDSCLYLPSFRSEEVGHDRFCIVIIQDQIIYTGAGPCRIPPVGAVVVLEKPLESLPAGIRWRTEFGGLPYPKEELVWLTGGFNLLYSRGRNLYRNSETSGRSLTAEGWNTRASARTQETQLNPEKREPRCTLGRTCEGSFLLFHFAGRSKLSPGATFGETVEWVEKLIPENEKLDFLINLDGGASASIVYHEDNLRINTTLTAPSFTNPAGVPRRLSGYLSIKINSAPGE